MSLCDEGYRSVADEPLIIQPRDIDAISRIYSPTNPAYIDVHLYYYIQRRWQTLEWAHSLGYKIHSRPQGPSKPGACPADLDFKLDLGKAISRFSNGDIRTMHSGDGWHSVMWATWDPMDGLNEGKDWKRVELRSCDLYPDGIIDIYEALFGPLPEIPDDADQETREKAEQDRRVRLVGTVRVLQAAVGIDYDIAVQDSEDDDCPGCPPANRRGEKYLESLRWMIEGYADKWFARETREACGFQLTWDPEQKKEGEEDQEEERNRVLNPEKEDYYF